MINDLNGNIQTEMDPKVFIRFEENFRNLFLDLIKKTNKSIIHKSVEMFNEYAQCREGYTALYNLS